MAHGIALKRTIATQRGSGRLCVPLLVVLGASTITCTRTAAPPGVGDAEAGTAPDIRPDGIDASADLVPDVAPDEPAEPSDLTDMTMDSLPDAQGTGFNCISAWPRTPDRVLPQSSLTSVKPDVVWNTSLSPRELYRSPDLVLAGTGVGVVWDSNVALVDGGGRVVAQAATDPANGILSSPVSAPDGSLFVLNSREAIRIGSQGNEMWKTTFNTDGAAGEFAYPWAPVLDDSGHLHATALDGNLWTFDSMTGQTVWKHSVGRRPSGQSRLITMGVGDVLFMDRAGLGESSPGAQPVGTFSPERGAWEGVLSDGAGWYPAGVMVGWNIGIVATGYRDLSAETTEIVVLDRCGILRWKVPGNFARPAAIAFDDDLIVFDWVPTGRGRYQSAVRRLSKDGKLLASSSPVDEWYLRGFLGEDDMFYVVSQVGKSPDPVAIKLVAFDSTLQVAWTLPIPTWTSVGVGVMGPDGKIVLSRGPDIELIAIQTTSPGAATTSWPQNGRDGRNTRWLSPAAK